MTHKLTVLAFLPALAIGVSACGSSTEPGATQSTSSTPSMSMPMTSTAGSSTPEGATSAAPDASAALISITDFTFMVPASVAPGATITIKNDDSQAHTVTSTAGGFDVKVDPNGTATLTAPDQAGSYPFVCSFHADMTATLVVR